MLVTKSASGGERMIETTTPWLVLYTMLGYLIGYGVISTIMNRSFNRGYWMGRAHGWQSHRRLTDIKVKSDEVFDYDKH